MSVNQRAKNLKMKNDQSSLPNVSTQSSPQDNMLSKSGDGLPSNQNFQSKVLNKRTPIKVDKKVGRNEPCPCGSGKKYKKCHG